MKTTFTLLLSTALLAPALVGCNHDDGAAPTSSAQGVESAGAAPKIVAAEPVFKFGKIKQGTEVEHVFKIRNTGNAPLQISKAKGS